jgi:hypothetical protein
MPIKVLVYGFAGALEVPVVIDDQRSADRHPRIEMLELMAGRRVVVSVEAQQSDRLRRRGWNGVLDQTLDQVDPLGRIPGLRQHVRDLGARHLIELREFVNDPCAECGALRLGSAAEVHVVVGGIGLAFKGIEPEDVAIGYAVVE